MKCEYCFKKVNNCSKHLAKCRKWREKKKQILATVTKEFLQVEYIEKTKPLGIIARDLGLRHTRELFAKLKEFNLQYLNYKNDEKRKLARINKAKETSLKKYGYEFHLTKGCKIRNKLVRNLKKKFGVTNVYQLESVKNKIKQTNLAKYGVLNASSSAIVRQKVKNTCLRKYGVDNVWKREDIIERMKIKRFKTGSLSKISYSKQSERFFNYLFGCLNTIFKDNEIYYAPHSKEFGKRSNKQYYFYDFVIPTLKFCIEYQGNYHHANPRMYNKDKIIHGNKAEEIWKKDKDKINFLYEQGFEVWAIWENDFIGATDFYIFTILQRINELCHNQQFNIKTKPIIFESNIVKDTTSWRNHENLF